MGHPAFSMVVNFVCFTRTEVAVVAIDCFLPEETPAILSWPSESFRFFYEQSQRFLFSSAILSSSSFSLRAASCLALRSAIAFSTAALCAFAFDRLCFGSGSPAIFLLLASS